MDSTTTKSKRTRREPLNLLIWSEERGSIDRAATLIGKTQTDFVLEAARHAAEETLLDRTIFTVSPRVYTQFLARLDKPPSPNDGLRRTMQAVPYWA